MGCDNLPWLVPPERQAEISGVAVAILRTEAEQRHTGLIYRADDEYRMVHLAWHHRVYDERAGAAHAVPLRMDEFNSALAATACGMIAARFRRGGVEQLPYGFRHVKAAFVGEGRLNIAGRTSGMTCATFVLAILDYAGVDLIDIASWPERSEDTEWQNRIISMLESGPHRASPEHVAAVRDDLPCVRVRPEEVAVAANRWPPTVKMDSSLEADARLVVSCLDDAVGH